MDETDKPEKELVSEDCSLEEVVDGTTNVNVLAVLAPAGAVVAVPTISEVDADPDKVE